MGQSSQSTNSTTTSAPWSVQTPYLQQGFSGAANALNTAQSNAGSSTYGAPSQFLAGFNPQQLANFNAMIGYGSNSTIPGQEAATGGLYSNTGATAANNAVSGLSAFNPAANNNIQGASAAGNAYAAGANIPGQVAADMLPAEQAAQYGTLPQMQRVASATGNANSSALANNSNLVSMGLGQQAEADAARLQGQYYNTGAGLYENAAQCNNAQNLAALEGQGQLGSAYGQLGTGALNSSLAGQGSLFNTAGQGATGLQEAAQNPLSNQLQAYNFGQSSPFQALDNFWNVIGSGQWGGTSNTQGTTTYSPSMASMVGGMMGAAGSMFGGNGMFGSGNQGGAFGSNGIFSAAPMMAMGLF